MTIFHVIKYADIDIYNDADFMRLPKSVVIEFGADLIQCTFQILEHMLEVETEFPMVEDTLHLFDDYFDKLVGIEEFDQIYHDITKSTLQNPGASTSDKHIAECIRCAFISIEHMYPQNVRDLCNSIQELIESPIDFDTYCRDRLKSLLLDLDN